MKSLTVDGNGNALREDELAVGADEGRDLAERVDLLVVLAHALGDVLVDKLNIEIVVLRNREEGGGARVVLLSQTSAMFTAPYQSYGSEKFGGKRIRINLQRRSRSFRRTL